MATWCKRCNRVIGEGLYCHECERISKLESDLAAEREKREEVEKELEQAREALKPFTHPDLLKETAGNVEGDKSPVFGRDKALLTLGDFRRASKALKGGENEKKDGKAFLRF